jgi:spore germination protein GerM
MQAGRGGMDLQLVKTDRRLRVSDSPLLDSLNALLAGPSADERNRGLISFIPPDTRIISALVRGNTAYLNFNEEFQYNTYGREGSAAQIRQIIWTATEFGNIHNVQFLIEGNRQDFLAEGVMIGSPIGR